MGGGADPGLSGEWHEVARGDEVPAGEVVRRSSGRTELILWRRPNGDVVCQEAWCPHAWADLRGARVTDDGCVECPFHAWRFDADGFHVQLFRPPNARERLRTFPVREDGGVVYAWW